MDKLFYEIYNDLTSLISILFVQGGTLGKRIISILDTDNLYAKRLSDYLELHSQMEYTLTSFTDIEQFILFNASNHSFVLIVNESLCGDLFDFGLDCLDYTNLFVISESSTCDKYEFNGYKFKTFFKYQSAKSLTQSFFSFIDDKKATSENVQPFTNLSHDKNSVIEEKATIVGVYSPIKRSGRTSFSVATSLALSIEHPCLLISFDENATDYFSDSVDVSLHNESYKDKSTAGLIYSYLDNKNTFVSKIHLHTHSYGNLRYSTPASISKDLRLLESDTICGFLSALSESDFKYVIIDFGDTLCDIYSALSFCDVIFTPTIDDSLSIAKYNNFLTNTTSTLKKESFIPVTPPMLSINPSSTYFSNLLVSDLLTYTHEKIMEVLS